jgi:hypothetical protein
MDKLILLITLTLIVGCGKVNEAEPCYSKEEMIIRCQAEYIEKYTNLEEWMRWDCNQLYMADRCY